MFAPELEARVVAAVRTALASPSPEAPAEEERAMHQLCEATSALLEAFLQLSDDWPAERFIDGLAPLSVQGGDDQLELVAAAIVAGTDPDETWVIEPLIAHFVLDGDALADVTLLFAYRDQEPPVFDPEQPELSLELPKDADGFLYQLSTAPETDEAT
jgi:hypothetical protein